MTEIENTEDYEKEFLEKYFRKEAQNKIQELEQKISECHSEIKAEEFKKKIDKIKDDLEKSLHLLFHESSPPEKIELGHKSENITEGNTMEFYEYLNIKVPINIWNYLFDYQKDGVKWMIRLFFEQKGGVLADEMGLGKTIQVITFIIGLIEYRKDFKVLVLCPATLVDQWKKEFERLNCKSKISSSGKDQITIISYELFRKHGCAHAYDGVFLDEGHKIKNKDSLIRQAVSKIKSRVRVVITGTPIQNNLSELWSIMDFTNPNILGSYRTFNEEFESRINRHRSAKEKETSYKYSIMLRSIIEPFIMRRLKSQINHKLPTKKDHVIFTRLSDCQKRLYINALESKRFAKLRKKMFRSKDDILGAISYLRKICNHPALVEFTSYDKYDIKGPDTDNDCRIPLKYPNCQINDSGKVQVAFELLEKWKQDRRKVLLFFQTVQMLDIFAGILHNKSEYNFQVMTGNTPVASRSSLIDAFNTEERIFLFLLTTKVGGYGLNLTGASRIIIFDPDWNPSMDNQAKERIYRFGQTLDVEIYRLISKNTIENKIYEKQIYKDCLSRKILNNPDTAFTRQYFFDLFSFYNDFDDSNNTCETEPKSLVKNSELIKIKEEDKRDFEILSELNSKRILSGRELIELILRRETNLE